MFLAPKLRSDKHELVFAELEQGDIPSFYTYEEGLSHLTAEGQATLERLEGMFSPVCQHPVQHGWSENRGLHKGV